MIFCTQAWQHEPVILVFEKLRQGHEKFKASLGYGVKSRPTFATKKPCLGKQSRGRQDGSGQRCLLSKPEELSVIPSGRKGRRDDKVSLRGVKRS